jgi:hypothetical protein
MEMVEIEGQLCEPAILGLWPVVVEKAKAICTLGGAGRKVFHEDKLLPHPLSLLFSQELPRLMIQLVCCSGDNLWCFPASWWTSSLASISYALEIRPTECDGRVVLGTNSAGKI